MPADYSIPGSPAGLARIDAIMHSHSYTSAFGASPLVFGAFPSLHAGSATMEALFMSHFFPKFKAFYWVYVGWLYWATMYLSHHYLVDAVAGSCLATATFYILMPEHLRDPHGLPSHADLGKEKLPMTNLNLNRRHRRVWSAATNSEIALDDLPPESPMDATTNQSTPFLPRTIASNLRPSSPENLLPHSESRSSSISHASSNVHSRSQTPNKSSQVSSTQTNVINGIKSDDDDDDDDDDEQHSFSSSSHNSRIDKHSS